MTWEKEDELQALEESASIRRTARRELRRTSEQVANAIAEELRVGDKVDVEGAIYEVLNVVWRGTEDVPDDYEGPLASEWYPGYTKVLTRTEFGDALVLSDPRRDWVDPSGLSWTPSERVVYRSDARKLPAEKWDPLRFRLASDDDLVAFATDSAEVRVAFSQLLRAQAAEISDAVALLRGKRLQP